MNTLRQTGLFYLWLTMLVLMADLATKAFAQSHLDLHFSEPVLPFFNLTLAYNTGAAFSFLDTGSFWPGLLFGAIATVASIALLLWLYRSPRKEHTMNIALALILGGALGNLWDRIRYQHVIDFIDLYVASWHWPVFNVADAAVSVGAMLMIWHWMRKNRS